MSSSASSFTAQFRSLGSTYWWSNLIEVIERFAYYGLRTVISVYMLLAIEEGGPEFDNIQKGQIFAIWAAVQSFVPILSGGFADRYGYKRTVAVSIAIKMAGYLIMGLTLPIAALLLPITAKLLGTSNTLTPGHWLVFLTFAVGAVLLAFGTAVFKPGIQGLIAAKLTPANNSLGWGIFYQCVNVGGFFGPILAGYLRLLDWTWVFFACTGIVSLNYLILLAFPEPIPATIPAKASFFQVARRSVVDILEPRLIGFLAAFSGFWAMFYQLFDLLPNFIDDWVDTRPIYSSIVQPLFAIFGTTPPVKWAGHVPQEQIVNLNAGLIMIFAFAVGYLTGKLRAMTAMIIGVVVSAVGILVLGSTSGWQILAAIAIFSFGEMMASPTKSRYFSELAPPGKKGLYLGYINATQGIGWSLGSLIAGHLYETTGDKVAIARRYLIEVLGQPAAQVEKIQKTEVLTVLSNATGHSISESSQLLWNTYDPTQVWWLFAWIGVVSMLSLLAYDRLTRWSPSWEGYGIAAIAWVSTSFSYGLFWGTVFGVLILIGCWKHGVRPAVTAVV